jgi:hypothetical protein
MFCFYIVATSLEKRGEKIDIISCHRKRTNSDDVQMHQTDQFPNLRCVCWTDCAYNLNL